MKGKTNLRLLLTTLQCEISSKKAKLVMMNRLRTLSEKRVTLFSLPVTFQNLSKYQLLATKITMWERMSQPSKNSQKWPSVTLFSLTWRPRRLNVLKNLGGLKSRITFSAKCTNHWFTSLSLLASQCLSQSSTCLSKITRAKASILGF